MESVSINQIQKFQTPQFVITQSKCVFKIENFNTTRQEIISAKVNFYECDIEWWIRFYPRSNANYILGSSSSRLSKLFTVMQIRSEHLWKSKKYEYRLSGTLGTLKKPNIKALNFNIAFSSIAKNVIEDDLDIHFQNEVAEFNESAVLIVNLEVKQLGDPIRRQKKYCTMNAKLEWSDQYSNLLNDSTFSDFTFVVKGKSFRVHKCILASLSETMRAMFTTNAKELLEGECIVDHIEPDIFQHLLQFVYSGKIAVDKFDNICMDLYKAAHYYRIEKLMETCKESIHFMLNAGNALEIYELTGLYDMEDVKADAWRIIKYDILKTFAPLKDEPLHLKDIYELIDIRKKEAEFWNKHIKRLKQ